MSSGLHWRLFAVSSQALQELAANPRRLGAQLGFLGVLHIWSRTLIYHPHIHYLVPGGGLSPDGRQWIASRPKFFLRVEPLGAQARTLFKSALQKDHPELFGQVPAKVWKRAWIVDSRAVGSGEHALRYLARYVFKTATSNRTVRLLPEGKVLWSYRQSSSGQPASVKLDPPEWLRRFLQHVLPRSFARVRTFGWLHPAAKVRGNRVRALLHLQPRLSAAQVQAWKPPADPDLEPEFPGDRLPPVPLLPLCPCCGQPMRLIGSWHAGQPPLLARPPP